MAKVHAIVDLQFGSTGKGLLAGVLAKKLKPDVIVTAWGPNAGHTFIDATGRKFVNIALPNGLVSPSVRTILLGPGSIINPDILFEEIERYEEFLTNVRIMIHPHAAVVTQDHRDREARYGAKIGSTMKGVGEAFAAKILRRVVPGELPRYPIAFDQLPPNLKPLLCTIEEYNAAIDNARTLLVEGCQGFSLSINHGFYPYTTSRDCTVGQLFSDCAIPQIEALDAHVYGTARTFPIRVANRFDASGTMIGTSGPCYPDQRELEWKDIGVEPELTTVTKLPRRIFSFSKQQIAEAIRMNGCDDVFLNFCNYGTPEHTRMCVQAIESCGVPVTFVGHGPSEFDVLER